MKDHIKVLGILWIICGGLSIFLAIFIFLLGFGVALFPSLTIQDAAVVRIIGIVVGSFCAFFGLPKIIGGIGLLYRKEWARILLIILSFFSLLNFPVGTALGIYTMIVLFNREIADFFKQP